MSGRLTSLEASRKLPSLPQKHNIIKETKIKLQGTLVVTVSITQSFIMIERPSSPVSVHKGVRFVEEYNTILQVESFLDIEENIAEKLWYSPDYHRKCKVAVKREAREWRKSGLGILLDDAFVNPNPKQVQQCLNAFAQLSDTEYARGVERHLSQEHDAQRVQRKRHFILDVVEQARYLDSLGGLSADEKRDKLAEFSSLQSKIASVFASRIAKADEVAAREGPAPQVAVKLVSKLLHKYQSRRNSIETSRPHTQHVMPTHESRRSSF